MLLKRVELFSHLSTFFKIIVFTDGAYSAGKSGVGCIFMDSSRKMIYILAGPSTMTSSISTEFEAFLLACRILVYHWKDSKAIICSDSSILVSLFMKFKAGILDSNVHNLDFSRYGLDFSNIWAQHIDRSINQEADFLAKSGASSDRLVAGKV